MEIIGGEPRRRWSLEQKLEIVAATFRPGASVNGVAREVGANPGMVFGWRKQYRAQLGFPDPTAESGFTPVMLAAPTAPVEMIPASSAGGVIEVEFAKGIRLRFTGPVSPDLAAAVTATLDKR